MSTPTEFRCHACRRRISRRGRHVVIHASTVVLARIAQHLGTFILRCFQGAARAIRGRPRPRGVICRRRRLSETIEHMNDLTVPLALVALELGVPTDELVAKLNPDTVLVDAVGLRCVERHVAARLIDAHRQRQAQAKQRATARRERLAEVARHVQSTLRGGIPSTSGDSFADLLAADGNTSPRIQEAEARLEGWLRGVSTGGRISQRGGHDVLPLRPVLAPREDAQRTHPTRSGETPRRRRPQHRRDRRRTRPQPPHRRQQMRTLPSTDRRHSAGLRCVRRGLLGRAPGPIRRASRLRARRRRAGRHRTPRRRTRRDPRGPVDEP